MVCPVAVRSKGIAMDFDIVMNQSGFQLRRTWIAFRFQEKVGSPLRNAPWLSNTFARKVLDNIEIHYMTSKMCWTVRPTMHC